MNIFLKQEAHSLQAWLNIALSGLAAPAQERLRMEIGAHYTDAVETHREKGLSESDALMAALTELGDPDIAAKYFRKRYLTSEEAEKVKQTFSKTGSYIELSSCLLLVGLCLYLNLRQQPSQDFWLLFTVGLITGISILNFNMIRRRSKYAGFIYLARALSMNALVCTFLSLISNNLMSYIAIFSFNCYPALKIQRKLRHIANIWHEISLHEEP